MIDEELLRRDKYNNENSDAVELAIAADMERLAGGEPLAYVIGWVPFCGLRIYLEAASDKNQSRDSFPANSFRPLIPRPETEWWTEKLIEHLRYKFEDRPFALLDLCAGSGAIGIAILSAFPNARVSFGEIEPAFESVIRKNILENNIDTSRADIRIGNVFEAFSNTIGDNAPVFDIIATNPPYIPEARKAKLSAGVTAYEPHNALFSGEDGLEIITQIIQKSPNYLTEDGELWMECDISNIKESAKLAENTELIEVTIHDDLYGRPRLLTATREGL